MDQYGRVRVNRFQIAQALGLELIVNNTGTVPQQYVGTGFPLHITAEVLVRRPQDFLPERVKIIDNFQRDTRGYNPVRTSLDRRRGIGIHHHGAIRVLVTKSGELVRRAADIQRAGGFQSWH